MSKRRREGVTCEGPYNPLPLEFLRSRACAELSPHSAKLLLDIVAQMGPNGFRNGDITIAPKVMAVRGWTSRASLAMAAYELETAGIIRNTRDGGLHRPSLWALTLYAINCDQGKLNDGAGHYLRSDWTKVRPDAQAMPTESNPAVWTKPRKSGFYVKRGEAKGAKKTARPYPLGNGDNENRSPMEQPAALGAATVPTGNGNRRFWAIRCSPTGHLSEDAIRRLYVSAPVDALPVARGSNNRASAMAGKAVH